MENGYVESFNGRFRDECLNENWFLDLADAREKIEQWRRGLQPSAAAQRSAISPRRSLRGGARLRPAALAWLRRTKPASCRRATVSLAGAVLENQKPEKVSLSVD